MPMYEYQCRSCGQVFEIIQKFSDAPLSVHEACGGAVERLISAPALQFKGSGWYITDYARGAKSANGKGEKSADTKSDSGGDSTTKTETKSESTVPAKIEK